MKIALGYLAVLFSSPALAQEPVIYLGAFDTAGSSISVAPLDDTRLEYCWTTTSQQSRCENFAYSLSDGTAIFTSSSDGRFEFDLVTNVLMHRRPDGVVKFADMTPTAR